MNDPITPAPPATQTLTAPAITPTVEPTTQADLTPAEASHMAEWAKQDLAKGKITAEQAEKIFTDLNTPLEQRALDTRSDEEKMLDKQFPPAQPRDYSIAYAAPGKDVVMTPELKQGDTLVRGWMHTLGLPKPIGDSLAKTIATVVKATKNMTEDELEAYGQKEFEKLQRVHGEKLEERSQAYAHMIDAVELKQPGLKNFLKSKGMIAVTDNALVVNTLLNHAPIFHARKR